MICLIASKIIYSLNAEVEESTAEVELQLNKICNSAVALKKEQEGMKMQTADNDTEASDEALYSLEYIVDITIVNKKDNIYQGNTATIDGYSGIIKIQLSDNLVDSTNVEAGSCYKILASPIIDDSSDNYPFITATEIELASSYEIKTLEGIREQVSNFDVQLLNYSSMELNEVIIDANNSYASWTQAEIEEYIEYIISRGYAEDTNTKSLVCMRNDIADTYKDEKTSK